MCGIGVTYLVVVVVVVLKQYKLNSSKAAMRRRRQSATIYLDSIDIFREGAHVKYNMRCVVCVVEGVEFFGGRLWAKSRYRPTQSANISAHPSITVRKAKTHS